MTQTRIEKRLKAANISDRINVLINLCHASSVETKLSTFVRIALLKAEVKNPFTYVSKTLAEMNMRNCMKGQCANDHRIPTLRPVQRRGAGQ